MAEPDRTEPATAHKKREARLRGQVPKSIDVNTAVILIAGFIALRFFSGFMYRNMELMMRTSFNSMGSVRFTQDGIMHFGLQQLYTYILLVLPFMLVIVVAAITVNLLQVGFMHSLQVLKPQLSRINPLAGMRRFFISSRMLVDLVKTLVKVAITAVVVYGVIKGELMHLMATVDMEPLQSVAFIGPIVFRLGMRISLTLGTLAAVDYFYQRWAYEKSLRMTKQEVKEELIRYEGRPEVRSRIRNVQRQMAMRRMMQEVPKADVVITNPTHLAIALQYDPSSMSAPKVVAKGARLVAQRIKEIARKNNVPVVENKPIAQMLFKLVDIGQMIPLQLYQAVADILAFVWRSGKNKKRLF